MQTIRMLKTNQVLTVPNNEAHRLIDTKQAVIHRFATPPNPQIYKTRQMKADNPTKTK